MICNSMLFKVTSIAKLLYILWDPLALFWQWSGSGFENVLRNIATCLKDVQFHWYLPNFLVMEQKKSWFYRIINILFFKGIYYVKDMVMDTTNIPEFPWERMMFHAKFTMNKTIPLAEIKLYFRYDHNMKILGTVLY